MFEKEDPWGHIFGPYLDYVIGSALATESQNKKENDSMFIVGSITNGCSWSISAQPGKHTTESSAKTEAARLAKLSPGKEYVVLEVKGKVKAVDVVWSK